MNDIDTHAIEVPGYRLVRPVGRGGAATVYVATQRSLERQVAVKLFDAMDTASVARFEQLLRTNARLSHPHTVGIHQIGRGPEGRLFHSMPFLLSAGLSRHNLRLKPLTVAAMIRELLEALDHAHRHGIVHGGIKPTNVLLDPNGHARLADFGIARCAAELGLQHPDAAGYLSPEQARGNPPGRRSDLYSIGVLAFEFLTGELPFHGEDAIATAVAHIEQPIPRLPPMAGAWQAWIDTALAKSPERRFQSAQEMADSLSAIDGRRGNGNRTRSATRVHMPKWALAVAVLVVATALAAAGWATWGPRPESDPNPGGSPATPTAGTARVRAVPATARPAAAGSLVSPLLNRIQTLVAQADALRKRGHWFAPRGDNAAEEYMAVLVLDPGNPAATKGIDTMLTALRGRLGAAWRGQRIAQAITLLQQSDLLATRADPVAGRAWHAERAGLAREVGSAIAATATAHNPRQLARLKPLAEALPAIYPAGFSLAAAEQRAAIPTAGAELQDRGGPLLVYVPASDSAPAFAIARVEVTRADYAAFANATHRPVSRCLEPYNPFSRLRHLTWQAPGFAQGNDHPVVCVSWNDAVAYAAWLSSVTGKPYRLPTDDQWLRAAQGMPKGTPCQLGNIDDASRHSRLDNDRWPCNDGAAQTAPVGHYAPSGVGAYDMYGNVSEWLAGGTPHARPFRGLSWRDGSHRKPLGARGTADSDVGYTSVGFRVARAIDATHPAPPSVDHH